jgi:ABC-type lipoprotein export system ATPase subunit
MYINRIILRDVRNFKNLDITLRNEWTKEHLKSVLFTGPNGSGKSTLLEVTHLVWLGLYAWLKEASLADLFKVEDGLVAIELVDFFDEPYWIYSFHNKSRIPTSLSHYLDFMNDVPKHRQINVYGSNLAGNATIKQRINEQLDRLLVGISDAELLPNMIYLTAVERSVTEYGVNREFSPEPFYKWRVTYNPQATEWQKSLEGMIAHHTVRNPDEVARVIEAANKFLVDKEIYLDVNSLKLMVRIGETIHHYSELSSGERQAILLLFMVTRWLMPGGIVLIDEPDLYLHISLQRQFIHTVEKIVHGRGGQLLVTSHSPTLWEEFNERQRINLAEEDQHDD